MTSLDKNELAEAGVQFGNPIRWRNPRMRPYIYKETAVSILDLRRIITSCQEVGNYIKLLVEKKKTILFLATKKQACKIVKEAAIRCDMPYIVNKWKGGFLTNFQEIGKKLKELRLLNYFIQKDSFRNLIKKEQVSLEKRRNKLQSLYEGVINLWGKPDALFIIGLQKEKTAFKEAKSSRPGVPVIAVCNTNCNPQLVDYVLPGNDESVKSITFFANLVADTIIELKKGEKLEKSIDKQKGEAE